MLLGINSPCYEVNFTSKSVSEQLKADDVLLQNQQSNPTTKKQIKTLIYRVISPSNFSRL